MVSHTQKMQKPLLWKLDLLLTRNPAHPQQPEISKSRLNDEGEFNHTYAEALLRPFMEALPPLMERLDTLGESEREEAVDLISQGLILVNRLELYGALRYHANYDRGKKKFFEQSGDFCVEQKKALNNLKRDFFERWPNESAYSPELQYEKGVWDDASNRTYELGTDFGKFTADQNIWVKLGRGPRKSMSLVDALYDIDEYPPEERAIIWKAREELILGDEFRSGFMGRLAVAKEIESYKRASRIAHRGRCLTDARAGFSEQEEQDWLDAVGISDAPVSHSFAGLYYDFVHLKAKYLGKKLSACDMRAPIYDSSDTIEISQKDAKAMVSDVFDELGPSYKEFIEQYFTSSGCIDTEERSRKDQYPYTEQSHYTPSFISMRSEGALYDVATLAHELGHAIHYKVCAQRKPPEEPALIRDEFITAVFELLATEKIVERSKECAPTKRIELLNNVIRGTLNTIVTSASFHEMEKFIHAEAAIPPRDRLESRWMELTAQTFGPDFEQTTYMQHLYDDPYFLDPLYSHIYSKTMCMAMAVVERYRQTPDLLGAKMLQFIQEPGGRLLADSLENIFDIKAKDAWSVGRQWVSGQLDTLKELMVEVETIKSPPAPRPPGPWVGGGQHLLIR